ncbi:hypothetical protein T492DRAFT_1124832 [Pavlovales sp. CCMP2436]|nr:hypothetical protein T492DRAFT_1124832 [Pavlovales sp. CCMP2436]
MDLRIRTARRRLRALVPRVVPQTQARQLLLDTIFKLYSFETDTTRNMKFVNVQGEVIELVGEWTMKGRDNLKINLSVARSRIHFISLRLNRYGTIEADATATYKLGANDDALVLGMAWLNEVATRARENLVFKRCFANMFDSGLRKTAVEKPNSLWSIASGDLVVELDATKDDITLKFEDEQMISVDDRHVEGIESTRLGRAWAEAVCTDWDATRPLSRAATFEGFVKYLVHKPGASLNLRSAKSIGKNFTSIEEKHRVKSLKLCVTLNLPETFTDVVKRHPTFHFMRPVDLSDEAIACVRPLMETYIKNLCEAHGDKIGISYFLFNMRVGTEKIQHRGVVVAYFSNNERCALVYDPGSAGSSGVENFFRGSCMASTALVVYLMGLLKTTDGMSRPTLHATRKC